MELQHLARADGRNTMGGWWGRSRSGWKTRAGTRPCKPTGNLLSTRSKQQEAGHGLSPSGSLQLNINKGGLFLRDG